ncbi:S8 family serine peptidase [Candidatus Bathyarchaeota archaeon]|nr:S8 family serine peptidase [Candidatus Bathyarchaeota archaeon]
MKFKERDKANAVALKHAAKVARFYEKLGIHLLKLPPGLSAEEAMKRFASDSAVQYVSLDYAVQADVLPNDPRLGDLWGLHNTGQSGGTVDADVDAPEAWDITTGSSSVVVGVVDTGVDYDHEDLAANMWRNPGEIPGNGVDDDGNGYADDVYGMDAYNGDSDPMDDHNHGTHVAGTIGAVGGNGIGVVGVNWQVKIMALKFLGASGSGSTSGAIECINYAVTMKSRGINIRVLSNSWGGGGYSTALRDAIQTASNAGILFVAAAGNSASSNDSTPHYPSSYDVANVLAVASTDRNDQRSSFSNYGLTSVDVAAPGSNILSTVRSNQYASYSGTSMATPHVSGVAALILAADPTLSYVQLKKLILFTSETLSSLSDRILTGGRVNANNALRRNGNSLRIFRTLTTISAFVGDTVHLEVMAGLHADPVPGMTVTADFSNGSPRVTLRDDGVAPDTTADDGLFTASWTPSSSGSIIVTFTASAPGLASAVTTVSGAIARSYRIVAAPYSWTEISGTGTSLELGDESVATVNLPMSVRFAGQPFSSVLVSANGFVSFSNQDAGYSNKALPAAGLSNFIAVYWDDLIGRTAIDRGVVYWQTLGSEPYRQLIVEWKDFAHYAYPNHLGSVTFQATFHEQSEDVLLQYQTTVFGNSAYDRGASATVGIQLGSTSAVQYSYNSLNSITDASAILFTAGRALGSLHEEIPEEARVTPVSLDAPPSHFDWREKDGYNWMTSIRDQASCGSCAAFGAVAAVEGQFKIQADNPSWNLDLSEQHLFSCGGGSCSIGWYVSSALNYLRQYGTPDEACSPYKAQSGSGSCTSSCSDWQSRAYRISSWSWIATNPAAIQAALLNGPLVAAFDVYTDFFYYGGGVYRYSWGVYEGGHAVTIVGYDQPSQYWIVKNSWGPGWGESGYFRIAFGQVGIEQEVATLSALVSVATRTATLTQTSSMYTQATTTRTITSYTSTSYTSTSTVPVLTTIVLVPVTISQTLQSVEHVTSIRTTILTSYAETQTSTSTVMMLTTIVLVPMTTTSRYLGVQYVTPVRTVTVTSYTGTEASTSTVMVLTTIVLAPSTATVTAESTELLTSTTTTTVTNYTTTTTSTSTNVVYTTVATLAGAVASNPVAYLSFLWLLAVTVTTVTPNKGRRLQKARSMIERRWLSS